MKLTRRRLLTLSAPFVVAGCDKMLGGGKMQRGILKYGEWLSMKAHETIGRGALAREYGPEDLSPVFRENGSTFAESKAWQAHARADFVDWTLRVEGLVSEPLDLSLTDLRSMPARTQITRHDCVEGWSAIGGWTGVPLKAVLDRAGMKADAKYVVFWCSDAPGDYQYYESVDLIDAFHPQTILAYDMNGLPLPHGHGAPLRLRVERQLGYKHAKFVERIEVVSDFSGIGFGKGGFWQDVAGYEWYAGI